MSAKDGKATGKEQAKENSCQSAHLSLVAVLAF
jgi:hypothetical protein